MKRMVYMLRKSLLNVVFVLILIQNSFGQSFNVEEYSLFRLNKDVPQLANGEGYYENLGNYRCVGTFFLSNKTFYFRETAYGDPVIEDIIVSREEIKEQDEEGILIKGKFSEVAITKPKLTGDYKYSRIVIRLNYDRSYKLYETFIDFWGYAELSDKDRKQLETEKEKRIALKKLEEKKAKEECERLKGILEYHSFNQKFFFSPDDINVSPKFIGDKDSLRKVCEGLISKQFKPVAKGADKVEFVIDNDKTVKVDSAVVNKEELKRALLFEPAKVRNKECNYVVPVKVRARLVMEYTNLRPYVNFEIEIKKKKGRIEVKGLTQSSYWTHCNVNEISNLLDYTYFENKPDGKYKLFAQKYKCDYVLKFFPSLSYEEYQEPLLFNTVEYVKIDYP